MHLKERVEVEVVGFLRGGEQSVALPARAREPLDENLALLVEVTAVVADRL